MSDTQYLEYPKQYLNLHHTLTCGQAFRWMLDDDGWWAAPVRDSVIRIREVDDGFEWQTLPGEPDWSLVADYFRLEEDVPAIYAHLSASDEHMAGLVNEEFPGLRIVRQDPTEAMLSYICSTANSVPRIMKAVEGLSRRYGRLIASVGGREHYTFPEPEAFVSASQDDLARDFGLGWRGPNIAMVASQILARPAGWLDSLRNATYEHAKSELLTIRGVGQKIADCICLFALDKDQAVPVDTHIRQVAERYFMPELKTKTVTDAAYAKIVRAFWDRYGEYAGWAQEFLYYEDLLRSRSQRAVPLAR